MGSLADHIQESLYPSRNDLSISDRMLTYFAGRIIDSGAPEGVTSAPVGSQYTDIATGNLYLKKSGTGDTGWELVESGGDAVTSVNGQTGDVSLSASDVGADPAGSSSTVLSTINSFLGNSSTKLDVYSRFVANNAATITSGIVVLTHFTPLIDTNIGNISFESGLASTTVTLVRYGLYTVAANGVDVTLVARTAADATIFGSANTVYKRALDATGGYPTSYNLLANTRYAVGFIVVGTVLGQFRCCTSQDNLVSLTPRLASIITGQTDLDASETTTGGISTPAWARLD